ncbi:MAG: protein kinase, partial [Planctomycetes bacterium]|nr:protein kinase [Planctomycetota bacterium]
MPLSVEDAIATLSELDLAPADEVRELLAAIPADDRPADGAALLEELARRGRLTKYQSEALRSRPPQPLLLSNYLLLDLLGAGGMGRVFTALHRRMERVVALKVLHERSIESPEAIERFHREVKAAARLVHPNIVAAYDAGEDRGLHFLVMEYVEGRDLATQLKEGPLPLAEAVRYVAHAA